MSNIRTTELGIGFGRGKTLRTVQNNLNLEASQGELTALVGPNGCGKSTLLRTLAGLQASQSGTIYLGDKELNIRTMSAHERAKTISLVLTDTVHLMYASVEQLVETGRHPYTSFSGKLNLEDKRLVAMALKAVKLEHLKNRMFSELSDGERQRVMIAKALAQDTPIILLDEPTSFLDLPNRIEILLLLKNLAHEMHKCILLSTHEIDLAIRLADKLWLMEAGLGIKSGSPSILTSNGSIQSVFKGESFGFDPQTGHVIIF